MIRPILFNSEMVRAILDRRKSCTRRLVKTRRKDACGFYVIRNSDGSFAEIYEYDENESMFDAPLMPPYHPGDILYVRETWCKYDDDHIIEGRKYAYKADASPISEEARKKFGYRWRPSIHMPKEAARIWLKVTDIRAERLQEITEEQACMEGTNPWDEVCYENNGWHPTFSDPDSGGDPNMVDGFHKLWNSTIKKSDIDRCGWAANPWVWVIEFERCDKEGRVVDGR